MSTNIQVLPGKVGISNANPIHTLDVGSNVYVDDAATNKLTVIGKIQTTDINVTGNMVVAGTTTVVNTENLTVKDPIIELANDSIGTGDTGLLMKRATNESNVAVYYDEGSGFKIGHTMDSSYDTQLTIDTANALPISLYGPVTVANASTSSTTTSGSLIVQGGVGINSNVTLGDTINFDGHVNIVGSGASTYVRTLRNAPVASNLVTYDKTTGELFDSGGLISNKLAIVSEQPPSALTGATTTVSGHGKYMVASSTGTAYNAFDKSTGVWTSGTTYNGTTGAYDGAVDLGGAQTESGEYITVEFPYKTVLRHVTILPGSTVASFPGTAYLYGTNDDGTTWTSLRSWSSETVATTSTLKTFTVNASAAYKKYALVVNATSAGSTTAQIGELRLFTETFTVDAGKVNMTGASGLETGFTEHPVAPMTDYVTKSEFGTYEASASSYDSVQLNPQPWRAFDYDHIAGAWRTKQWSNSTHLYTGPDVFVDAGGTRYNGPSLTIKMPYAIVLSHSTFRVWATTYGYNTAPKVGYIFGSNNGVDWYKLFYTSDFGFQDGSSVDDGELITVNVNATTPYTHYAFVCTEKNNSGTDNRMNLNEWRLFAEKDVTKFENVHIAGDLSSETLQTGYIKWPRVPLKANESEGYVASASSSTSGKQVYMLFNDILVGFNTEYWTTNVTYTNGVHDNTVSTTDINGVVHYGEWAQIQLPTEVALSFLKVYPRRYGTDVWPLQRVPSAGSILGSNDGTTWKNIQRFSGVTYTLESTVSGEKIDVHASETYKYYRLVCTTLSGVTSAADRVDMMELQLFEAATGVGGAPTSAKLQVHGSLGLAKGSSLYAGDNVVAEFPKHDRPLTKYPEVAITSSATISGYTATASSYVSREAWQAFDGDTSTSWTSDYGFTGSPLTGDEYLQLELPVAIKVVKMYIQAFASVNYQHAPQDAELLGSNDGTTWVSLNTSTDLPLEGFGASTWVHVNATQYYKYLRLKITKIYSGLTSYARVAELQYWGTEEGDESVDVVHRSVPNKPGQQQLAVYWDANDSNSYSFADSSNVYDLSGSGVTGVLTGSGNTFDTTYNAWKFTTSSSLKSPALSISGDYVHSMSVWFRLTSEPSTWSGGRAIMSLHADAGISVNSEVSALVVQTNGTVRDNFWGNDIDYNSPFKINTWHHVVFTYSGTSGTIDTRKIYVDTKLLTGAVTSGGDYGDPLSLPSNSKFAVGEMPGVGLQGAGDFANARLFSKALNADQVRELYEYDAPRFGHRTNVVALHKGNLGVGVTAPTSRFEVAGREDLQEYPPQAMTGYETYMEGHGVFRVSQSSEGSANGVGGAQAWKVFDDINDATNDNYWNPNHASTDHRYGGTGGIYTGIHSFQASSDSNPVGGEWLKIEFPHKFKLNNLVVQGRYNYTGAPGSGEQNPTDFRIIGSNDDSNWYILKTVTNQTGSQYPGTTNTIDTSHPPYKYYVFHVTHNAGSIAMSVGGLQFFGTPAPSSLEDGHLTLGKALTTPRVSGHAAGAETPRAESLVVHYDTTVDSVASGTMVVDTSGNGLNGTVNGTYNYSSSDRALLCGGTSSDYISTSGVPTTSDFVHSISVWAKVNSIGTNYIASIGTPGAQSGIGKSSTLYFTSSGFSYVFYGADMTIPFSVNTNTWYHIVAVRSSGGTFPTTQKLYINGVDYSGSASWTNTTSTSLSLPSSSTVYFGRPLWATGTFDGSISNFKLWNVALTADEVAAEYALGRTGKSINITDTAVCLGGTVPRAQLDVRGSMVIDGIVGTSTTGGLVIPSGTTAQRPTNPLSGTLRINRTINRLEYYESILNTWVSTAVGYATGGNDTYDLNGFRVHVFTGAGTFTAFGFVSCDILMVGGGGGGGADNGGGGGAGGLIFIRKTLQSGAYTINIGTGGTGAADQGTTAGKGGDTTAFGLTAVGGGYGNNGNNGDGTANSGGSGGGGDGERNSAGGTGTQPSQSGDSGTYGYGNDGGDAGGTNDGGGGGGGAGQAGRDGRTAGGTGGDGLNEVTLNGYTYNFATIFGIDYGEIINGEAWFAGGGAGGNQNTNDTDVSGGKGGGGSTVSYFPSAGTDNTGGGGGGSTYTGSDVPAGADGGNGIVIIRYPF